MTTAEVIADANVADSRVGPHPTTAFLQFIAPSADAFDETLAAPVWALGVDNIHFPVPGGYIPSNAATPKPYVGGLIFFVSDPSGDVALELGCPSG